MLHKPPVALTRLGLAPNVCTKSCAFWKVRMDQQLVHASKTEDQLNRRNRVLLFELE